MKELLLVILALLCLSNLSYAQKFTYAQSFDAKILSPGYPTPDGTPWNDTNKYPITIADVNGDGRFDIVGYGISGVYVAINTGFSFSNPTLWSSSYGTSSGWTSFDAFPRYCADLNGDGFADLVGFGTTGVFVQLSNSTHFGTQSSWTSGFTYNGGWTSFESKPKYVADVNGDGRADLVGFNVNNNVYVSLSTGTAFGSAAIWTTQFVTNKGWVVFTTKPKFMIDMNGDKKADIVGFNGTWWVLYSSGTGFVNMSSINSTYFAVNNSWVNQTATPIRFGDLNGDTFRDFININSSGIYAEFLENRTLLPPVSYYSFDTEGNSSYLYPGLSNIYFGDFDDDNITDVIAFTLARQGIKVYLNGLTGNSSATPYKCVLCNTTNSTICPPCSLLPIYYINGSASCAPGTQNTTTSRICTTMSTYINITLDTEDADFCENIVVNASIRPNEMDYYKIINFKWSVTSNTTNTTLLASLRAYVLSQIGMKLKIPMSYIEPKCTYTFTVSYLDALKRNLSASTVMGPFTHLSPNFFTSVTNITEYKRYQQTIIPLDINFSRCINPFTELINEWNQTLGVKLNQSVMYYDNKLIIPACVLLQNQTYAFTVKSYLPYAPKFSSTKTFRFFVDFDNFYSTIDFSNRTHSLSGSIFLIARTMFEGTCPEMNNSLVFYRWACNSDLYNEGFFSYCEDPDRIFGKVVNSTNLTISTSYFTVRTTLQISLTTFKQGRRANTMANIYVINTRSLGVQISCVGNCPRYNANQDIYLRTIIVNDPLTGYSLNWIYPTAKSSVASSNALFLNLEPSNFASGYFKVNCQVVSSYYSGYANYSIELNPGPVDGNLTVVPSAGVSFKTYFVFTTLGWNDTDLPLTYQFYYSNNGLQIPISYVQYSNQYSDYLPANPNNNRSTVVVNVIDSFGGISKATADVNVTTSNSGFAEEVAFLDASIQALSDTTIQSMKDVLYISFELKGLLDKRLNLRNYLQFCSGCTAPATKCLLGACTCKLPGKPSENCTITSDVYTMITNLNSRILIWTGNLYYNLIDSPELVSTDYQSYWDDMVFTILKYISSNYQLTSESNQIRIQRILENNLQAMSAASILSKSQLGDLAEIIDASISYVSQSDCECTSYFCLAFQTRLSDFISKFKNMTLNGKIAGQGSKLVLKNFDIMSLKLPACSLVNNTLNLTDYSPTINLSLLNSSNSPACSSTLDFIYMTFKSRNLLFNCSVSSADSSIKENVVLGIYQSGSETSLLDLYAAQLRMPLGTNCSSYCKVQPDYSCLCPSQIFDIDSQMILLFNGTNTIVIPVEPTVEIWEWNLMESHVTWICAGVLGWFVLTVFYVGILPKGRKMCVLGSHDARSAPRAFASMLKIFAISSDILAIYFLRTKTTPKIIRAELYFIRISGYAIVAALLATADTSTDYISIILSFNLEYYFLPYAAKILFMGIVHKSLKNLIEHKNIKGRFKKLLYFLAALLELSLILGAVYLLEIILDAKTAEFQVTWTCLFASFVIQDLTIVPILYMLYQLILISIITKLPAQAKSHKILSAFADQQIYDYFIKNLMNNVAQIQPSISISTLRRKPKSTANLQTEALNTLNPSIIEDPKPRAKEINSLTSMIDSPKTGLIEENVFDMGGDNSPGAMRRSRRKRMTDANSNMSRPLFKLGSMDLPSTNAIIDSTKRIDSNEDFN